MDDDGGVGDSGLRWRPAATPAAIRQHSVQRIVGYCRRNDDHKIDDKAFHEFQIEHDGDPVAAIPLDFRTTLQHEERGKSFPAFSVFGRSRDLIGWLIRHGDYGWNSIAYLCRSSNVIRRVNGIRLGGSRTGCFSRSGGRPRRAIIKHPLPAFIHNHGAWGVC